MIAAEHWPPAVIADRPFIGDAGIELIGDVVAGLDRHGINETVNGFAVEICVYRIAIFSPSVSRLVWLRISLSGAAPRLLPSTGTACFVIRRQACNTTKGCCGSRFISPDVRRISRAVRVGPNE